MNQQQLDSVRDQTLALVRIGRVKEITDSSKSTILRWVEAGKFPRPVVKDGNTVLWDLGEICAWREQHRRKRDATEQRVAA